MEAQDIAEDLPDLAGVHEGGQLGRESRAVPEIGPMLQVEDVKMEEVNQDELERNDSPAALDLKSFCGSTFHHFDRCFNFKIGFKKII